MSVCKSLIQFNISYCLLVCFFWGRKITISLIPNLAPHLFTFTSLHYTLPYFILPYLHLTLPYFTSPTHNSNGHWFTLLTQSDYSPRPSDEVLMVGVHVRRVIVYQQLHMFLGFCLTFPDVLIHGPFYFVTQARVWRHLVYNTILLAFITFMSVVFFNTLSKYFQTFPTAFYGWLYFDSISTELFSWTAYTSFSLILELTTFLPRAWERIMRYRTARENNPHFRWAGSCFTLKAATEYI